MLEFKLHNYYRDPDGLLEGPSGYAGRTGGSYVRDQRRKLWRDLTAAVLFEEGRPLAEQSDDPSALPLLVGQYGLVRYSAVGSARDYVTYGEEAATLLEGNDDASLRVAIWMFPAFGNWIAGDGKTMWAIFTGGQDRFMLVKGTVILRQDVGSTRKH